MISKSEMKRLCTINPTFAKMKERLDLLEEVAEAAKVIEISIHHVYSGYPGKLDWPELHSLKQALEKLKGETNGQ